MRRKHLTVLGEENKHPNCVLDPKDQTFKSKDQDFQVEDQPLKTEIESEDYTFVHLNKY